MNVTPCEGNRNCAHTYTRTFSLKSRMHACIEFLFLCVTCKSTKKTLKCWLQVVCECVGFSFNIECFVEFQSRENDDKKKRLLQWVDHVAVYLVCRSLPFCMHMTIATIYVPKCVTLSNFDYDNLQFYHSCIRAQRQHNNYWIGSFGIKEMPWTGDSITHIPVFAPMSVRLFGSIDSIIGAMIIK